LHHEQVSTSAPSSSTTKRKASAAFRSDVTVSPVTPVITTEKSRKPKSPSIPLPPQATPLDMLLLGLRLLNAPAGHMRSHRYGRIPGLKKVQTLMFQLFVRSELMKYITTVDGDSTYTFERYYDISVTGITTTSTGKHILHDFIGGTARMATSRDSLDDDSMIFTITVQGLDTDKPFLRFTPRDGDHVRLATAFWTLDERTYTKWGVFFGKLYFVNAVVYDFEEIFGTGSHAGASNDRLEGFDMQPAKLRETE
jgi:hypothetical protein